MMRWTATTIGGLCAALCLAGGLLPAAWQSALELHPASFDAVWIEPWRLLGAHLVHWSPLHAACNAAVLWSACRMLAPHIGAGALLGLLVGGALTIDLGLALVAPAMVAYRGASGLVALLLALVVLTRVSMRRRGVAALACLALVGLDAVARQAGVAPGTLPAGVESAWQAHLAGVLAAIAAVFARPSGAGFESAQDARIMRVSALPLEQRSRSVPRP